MTAAVFILFGVAFSLGVFYLARLIIRKADEEKE
jgi:uncharacterized membrane protein